VAISLKRLLGKIHQGDCINGMQQIPDGSVDLAFADPPFNIGFEYDQYDDRMASEKYLEWSRQWIGEVHRILSATGTFWLAIGDEYAAELKIESQKAGFHTRNWVVWYYTFGVHCKNKFTRSHAHLFYFVKDPSLFTFNRDDIAVPSARQLVYGDRRANPAGRTPDDTWILRPQDCDGGFTADEDTWYFPRVAGTFKERAGFHGCQMPEQLLGRIVKACSNPADVVLDPFSGSSTTLTVAKKLGRKFLGFELSEEYTRLGTRRLEAAKAGDRLEGAEEPKVSAPATNSPNARRRAANGSQKNFDFDESRGSAGAS
jgi:site-specific DNA-methyltransferase (adenine-specific)